MHVLSMLAAVGLLAGCTHAGSRVPSEGAALTQSVVLPALGTVTRVGLTDARSGAPIGAVVRADSVAALAAFYRRVGSGWRDGMAPGAEVVATFYRGDTTAGALTLASGAFGTRVGGRVLRRAVTGEEALLFARLAGLRVSQRAALVSAAR